MTFPKLSDTVPRRRRTDQWRTVADYAVFNRDGRLIISPWLSGFHHAEASSVFDYRADWDRRQNKPNRAAKYVRRYGS